MSSKEMSKIYKRNISTLTCFRNDREIWYCETQTITNMAAYEYVAVTNIPNNYHAADLRAHFSSLVETKSFLCFHFRHRPEKQPTLGSCTSSSSQGASNHNPKRCCVVKIRKSKLKRLLHYHGNNWTNVEGNTSELHCMVSSIAIAPKESGENAGEAIDESKLTGMPELNPPAMMPNGNVGTPTLVFLDLIQQCLLPQTFVKKLQLKFPKIQGKRLYATVDFDYGTPDVDDASSHEQNISSKLPFLEFQHKRSTLSCKPATTSLENIHSSCESSQQSEPLTSSQRDSSSSGDQCVNTVRDDSRDLILSSASIPSSSNQVTPNQTVHSESQTASTLTTTEGSDRLQHSVPHIFKTPAEDGPVVLSARERKQREKAERKATRSLMEEGIEERLIAIERRYHNDEDAEEWDRHEASEDDPSNQERNTERLYEQEEETPWEKGGPGVVFYTDAIFWQAREGDFDEKTTDDLDVDFSAYEEPGAGDKDIKDFLKIRQEQRFRSGYDKTDRFSIGIARRLKTSDDQKSSSRHPPCGQNDQGTSQTGCRREASKIGEFEKFTKGVGRRVMERHGWQDGQGLGSSRPGIKDALTARGQGPHNKRGLGFCEPTSSMFISSKSGQGRKKRPARSGLISTVYDDPEETDPKVPLLQRAEPSTLKHRQSHIERHASSSL